MSTILWTVSKNDSLNFDNFLASSVMFGEQEEEEKK